MVPIFNARDICIRNVVLHDYDHGRDLNLYELFCLHPDLGIRIVKHIIGSDKNRLSIL